MGSDKGVGTVGTVPGQESAHSHIIGLVVNPESKIQNDFLPVIPDSNQIFYLVLFPSPPGLLYCRVRLLASAGRRKSLHIKGRQLPQLFLQIWFYNYIPQL